MPQVQKKARHLTTFMRSTTWISPPVGAQFLEETKKHSSDETQQNSPQCQYYYTEEESRKFRENPQHLLEYRQKLESSVNNLFDMYIVGSETSKFAEKSMGAEMHRRIGPGHEELKERLIPRWAPGCKRHPSGRSMSTKWLIRMQAEGSLPEMAILRRLSSPVRVIPPLQIMGQC